MSAIYEHAFTVKEDPKNYIRHVNNLSYLQWFIDTAIAHSDDLGWGMQACKDKGLAWVVKSHHIEYLREAFQDDELIIYTWIHNITKSRSTRKYKCVRAKDKKTIATAETLWVLVDYNTGRPRPIPEELRKQFIILNENEEP